MATCMRSLYTPVTQIIYIQLHACARYLGQLHLLSSARTTISLLCTRGARIVLRLAEPFSLTRHTALRLLRASTTQILEGEDEGGTSAGGVQSSRLRGSWTAAHHWCNVPVCRRPTGQKVYYYYLRVYTREGLILLSAFITTPIIRLLVCVRGIMQMKWQVQYLFISCVPVPIMLQPLLSCSSQSLTVGPWATTFLNCLDLALSIARLDPTHDAMLQ